ncbi:MAG TPA: FAD-binding protein, partial [Terriglobia bacterium]|nr:FAD-binding protein [Terriglobia bacterium]
HPTGIYKMGILLSEAARGEGGILRNNSGERFMVRYAPTLKDLAPRDMTSRAIYQEIREGRGIGGKNYVHLDLTHLGKEVLDKKLPDITEFVRTYLGIEPLEDMEFFQFHPTGIYKMGILLSEAARGEGGILRNNSGERFMERYAPTLKDLAPRDMTSRAIYQEIREGRGIGGKNYVHLDLTHLGKAVLDKKLPDITEFVRTYLGLEPLHELVPIQPTAHYAMGGIPTDVEGRVVIDEKNTPMPGLYAAGEVACVSVHGANRLGTNSLVDILVFGRRGGRHAAKFIKESDWTPLPGKADEPARALVSGLKSSHGKERPADLRDALQDEMMDKASVFREARGLTAMREKLRELRSRYQQVKVEDRSACYNTELLEVIELGGLLDLAEVLVESALVRQESRGAHFREDFPKRDDPNWLKHTLAYKGEKGIEFRYKPVTITRFEPKERKY